MSNLTDEQRELDESTAKLQVLADELKTTNLAKYSPLITRSGKLKGELSHMTPRQYRTFTGGDPRSSIVIDGKIPWHLAMDDLATQEGYKSDEAFREAILEDVERRNEFMELRTKANALRTSIKESKETPLKVEHIKLTGTAPVFPKKEATREVVTEVNGSIIKTRRNPSFHQIEEDKDKDGTPDTVIRVRYAADAKKIVSDTARDYQADYVKRHHIKPPKTPKRAQSQGTRKTIKARKRKGARIR